MSKELLTDQEAFDHVALVLLKQGHQSLNKKGGCAYLGINGDKCAAGHLMIMEKYSTVYENCNVYDLSMDLFRTNHWNLLDDLQKAHDCKLHKIELWIEDMRSIAKNFNLKSTVLDRSEA